MKITMEVEITAPDVDRFFEGGGSPVLVMECGLRDGRVSAYVLDGADALVADDSAGGGVQAKCVGFER